MFLIMNKEIETNGGRILKFKQLMKILFVGH